MGGYGSNRWEWHQAKPVVEGSLYLDAKYMREVGERLALLMVAEDANAYSHSMTWRDGHGEEVGSVRLIYHRLHITDDDTTVALNYSCQGVDMSDSAHLVTTKLAHGGRRWWIQCKDCKKRFNRLYKHPQGCYFKCRVCHGMGYASQRESRKLRSYLRGLDMRELSELSRAGDVHATIAFLDKYS